MDQLRNSLFLLLFITLVLRNACTDAQQQQPVFTLPLSSGPLSIAIDPTTSYLFVSEPHNNRVLSFGSVFGLNSTSRPRVVFGQTDFNSTQANQGRASPSKKTLSNPTGIFVDRSGTLWVADSMNLRVLAFRSASTLPTDAAASVVFGQPNFTTSASIYPPTAASFYFPVGVYVDASGTLFVADSAYARVLVFKNAASLPFGTNATSVLGQQNFSDISLGCSAVKLRDPIAVTGTVGDALLVADSGNNRVVRSFLLIIFFFSPPLPQKRWLTVFFLRSCITQEHRHKSLAVQHHMHSCRRT